MSTNWGAALGAAVTTGLNTYERLGEEELREMQRKQLKKDIADKEAMASYLADAAQQKTYTGGSDVQSAIGQATKVYGEDADTARTVQGIIANQTPEQQQATLRAYGGAEGAVTPKAQEGALDLSRVGVYKNAKGETMASNEGTALSTADQYKYATKKATEAGNIAAIEKLTPLKAMMRESDMQDKFDTEKKKLDDVLARIQGTAESGGLKGLADAAKQEGLKVNFVEGKNGVGSRIQVLGPKGDVLETISDINTATDKLSKAAMESFYTKSVGLLGSPDKVIAAMQGERKALAAEKSATADMQYKGTGGVIDRAYSSGGKGGGKGGSNSAENQEKLVTSQAEILMKGDPKRFKDVDQAKAWIVNSKLKGYNAETEWGKTEAKLIEQGLPDAEISARKGAFFSRQGIAPDFVMAAAQSGIGPNGKPFTEADKQAFRQKYPNSYVEFGAPEANAPAVPVAAAIPAKGYVPEPGSPAAKSAEKRQAAIDTAAKDRAIFKEKLAAAKTSGFNPSSQFEVDKGTMTPEALRAKYLPLQRALTPEQFDYLNQ